MYGKRRVVLKSKPVTVSGLRVIVVAGNKSHHPIGFWYEHNGRYYADLRSAEQAYQAGINNENIAHKGLGGVSTKEALRELVMLYYTNNLRA